MNKNEERIVQKRRGTEKQVRALLQKKRVKSFLQQRLGTITHKSDKAYDRKREKASLRREIENA